MASKLNWLTRFKPLESSLRLLTILILVIAVTAVQASPASGDLRQAPNSPTLVLPTDNSTGVSTSPMLRVNVTDPGGLSMNVSFYGRKVGAAEDFTLIVLPDTQNYSQYYPAIFNSQTNWLVSQKTARNIVFVAGVGDVVNNNSSITEYVNADAAIDILDAGNVNYGLIPGNHDYGSTDSTNYNTYFGYSRYAGKSYFQGHYGSLGDNHYSFITAGGIDFILIGLQYNPSTAVLDWADALLKANAGRQAIVYTHNLLYVNGTWSNNTIYPALSDNPNLFMILCGHNHGENMRTDTNAYGTVYSIIADYQDYTNGGDGYLRIMNFSPANDTISIQSYSPYQNNYMTDGDSQFTLPYAMEGDGNYQLIGTVAAASGTNASVTWAGLSNNTEYEWYAVANNGSTSTTSPTWSFTTESSSATYPLTVSKTGTGTGTITSSPAGISCGTDCNQTYAQNTFVTLSHSEAVGSEFTGWSGACTGTGSCGVTMSAARNVTANFSLTEYLLTITSAHGTVTKNPNKATYHYGDLTQLTAVPTAGWTFVSWSGGLVSTSNPANVFQDGNTSVTANYVEASGYTLNVTSAHGTITKNPDKAVYNPGEVVQLTAAPAAGWGFSSWSGDLTSTSNPVNVTMNANKSITANYLSAYTLSITSAHGTVTKNPDKTAYTSGEVVQLTAAPAAGWVFSSWSGSVTSTSNPVNVTMNANKTITANYTAAAYTLNVTSAHGIVTKNPSKATYSYGEVVQLTAAPSAGWLFANWSGDLTGTANPANVTMTGNKTITAVYSEIGSPVPMLFFISPDNKWAGKPGFQLKVYGSNFVPGSIVRWNGQDRVTTYINVGKIYADLTTADLATASINSVTVFSPAPGGGTSAPLTFTVKNDVPVIKSLSPVSKLHGKPAFTLTIFGAKFGTGAVVRWNGADRPTTWINCGKLTVLISAADIAAAGTATVTVFNPDPGAHLSNEVTFLIN